MVDKKHKKSIVGSILSWIVGVIFILGGLGMLFSLQIISALVFFVMGIALVPPLNKFVSNKIKFDLSSKWIKALIIVVGFVLLAVFTDVEETTPPQQVQPTQPSQANVEKQEATQQATTQPSTPTVTKPAYDLEMSMEEIFNAFSGLSELQQEEKSKEFKGKRIKTSIYADKIDKASLSSQYVVMEMYEYPYNSLPHVKAFFPSEEKDSLLKANISDTIIFSVEFVSYREGGLTSIVEFTNSKFIEVEQKKESLLDKCYKKAEKCKAEFMKEGCYNVYAGGNDNETGEDYIDYVTSFCQ